MATAEGPDDRLLLACAAMPHPRGTRARVLLASVFGPYARDDRYGSRLINPMEALPCHLTPACK